MPCHVEQYVAFTLAGVRLVTGTKFNTLHPTWVRMHAWGRRACHAVSCRAEPCHAVSCRVMPCDAVSCRVVSCRVMPSCRVLCAGVWGRAKVPVLNAFNRHQTK